MDTPSNKNSILRLGVLLLCGAVLIFGVRHYLDTGGKETVTQFIKNSPIAHILPKSENCDFPILYSLGRIDSAFGVSAPELETAIAKAGGLWEKAAGQALFAESSTGGLKIGLVYDERQKETQMLETLGLSVDRNKASFEKIQTSYKTLAAQYETGNAAYGQLAKKFEADKAEFEAAVSYWNDRGGAPEKEYAALKTQEETLKASGAELERRRLILNKTVETLNSMGAVLNQMAKEMNIAIEAYNSGGAVVRNVFDAGIYESDYSGRRIYIYQFENLEKLSSVLAHELGHALGLEHNADEHSIMYKLNQGQIQTITSSDMAALKKECPNLK